MSKKIQAVLAACGIVAAGHAAAQITLYEGEGFHGRAVGTQDRIWNFEHAGINGRAFSAVVDRGAWEVCEHPRFEGRCTVLRRGNYPSLRSMGLDDPVASVRPMDRDERVGRGPHGDRGEHRGWRDRRGDDDDAPRAYAPPPPVYQPQPAFYDVPVASVHAVVGPPSQRCWIDREQVAQPRSDQPNLGGAVLGGIVGGILGHQVGGGSGKDLATAGGVVAGAALGANVNRGGVDYGTRDVQRCATVSNTQPAYWDASYWYRGVEHHVQLASAPGPTIRVNADGTPVAVPR